jgi:hypothetical protein
MNEFISSAGEASTTLSLRRFLAVNEPLTPNVTDNYLKRLYFGKNTSRKERGKRKEN